MNIIRLNPNADDLQRRTFIFDGDYVVYSKRPSLANIIHHAKSLIMSAFGNDAEKAQYGMSVAEFVKIAGALKTEFTNSATTKGLLRDILNQFEVDLEKTYFDVPRMRIVTSDNFLTAGVGYAYKAHRDTWYAAPPAQVNWWMPVYDGVKENCMSVYPYYFVNPIKNSSEIHDYEEWCNVGRKLAISLLDKDDRKHPLPIETVDETTETRFVLASGEIMLFSAGQLHATAPNTSGRTRFSIDFRTVHLDDLKQNVGAKNLDNKSTGSTLFDFIRAKDFERMREGVLQH